MAGKRSLGVTIVADIFILFGTLLLLLDIFFVSALTSGVLEISLNWFFSAPFGLILFPPFLLLIGIGIFLLRPWARKLVLYVFPLYIVIGFFSLIRYPHGIPGNPGYLQHIIKEIVIFSILVIAPLLIFFNHPKVKEQFRQGN